MVKSGITSRQIRINEKRITLLIEYEKIMQESLNDNSFKVGIQKISKSRKRKKERKIEEMIFFCRKSRGDLI